METILRASLNQTHSLRQNFCFANLTALGTFTNNKCRPLDNTMPILIVNAPIKL